MARRSPRPLPVDPAERESEQKRRRRERYLEKRDGVLEWQRAYNKHPEVRARHNTRRQRPDSREKRNERLSQRRQNDPVYLARWRAMQKATYIKRRRIKADTAVEPIQSELIFERDGWVCQLCFEDVDPLDFYPHSESASLDHIVPLSLGGTHTEDNVQLAHLRCNVSKGNRYEVAI